MSGFRNGDIKSFFKPFMKTTASAAPPRSSTKRPLFVDQSNEGRATKSPRITPEKPNPLPIRTDSPHARGMAPLQVEATSILSQGTSSQLSTLTPSDSGRSLGDDTLEIYPRQFASASPPEPKSTASPVNASFTSSFSTGSRRIELFGEAIITNSDSESDEFPDLNTLLNRPAQQVATSTAEDKGRITRSTTAPKVSVVDTSKADEATFNRLIAATKRDLGDKEAYKIALSLAEELEKSQNELESQIKQSHAKKLFTTEAIVSRFDHLDVEKSEKFAQAIDRTELMQVETQWSLFDASIAKTRNNNKWPNLDNHPAWAIYQDGLQRELALCGAVFEQAVVDRQLPEEVLSWILRQSFCEPRQDLWTAYYSVLNHASSYITGIQAMGCLRQGLEELGATMDVITTPGAIHTTPLDSSGSISSAYTGNFLHNWLSMASILCKELSMKDRQQLLEWLMVMTLDTNLFTNGLLALELQNAIAACVHGLEHDDHGLARLEESLVTIYHKAGDVYYRVQCLRTLPATTPLLCSLRKRLALGSFYEETILLARDPPPSLLVDATICLKKNPRFKIGKKTDYRKLAAYIACLDIAIADGDKPSSSDATTVKDYNIQVDELTEILRLKDARIQDVGAAHMSRTDAKEALEVVGKRLKFSVRTKPRRGRNMLEQASIIEMYPKAAAAAATASRLP